MKKYLLLSAVACTLAGCSNDFNPADVVVDKGSNTETKEAPIGFSATNKNMLRDANYLQDKGHYNFGVFAYKDTDPDHDIMADYLVGYMDATGRKGYKLDVNNQTTLQNSTGSENDNVSYWAYEKLGNAEYALESNQENESFYTTGSSEADKFYLSNNANQYLRYWDKSSTSTNFYAYAPYYHHNEDATGVTFDNSNHQLTLPIGAIQAGTDDATKYEAMYAAKNVTSTDYGKDVALEFKRLVSKIRIAFWEDIAGYGVTMQNLQDGIGISAAPAKEESPTHKRANILKQAGVTITFTSPNYDAITTAISDIVFSGTTNYTNYSETDGEFISFKKPTGQTTSGSGDDQPANRIATTKESINEATDY